MRAGMTAVLMSYARYKARRPIPPGIFAFKIKTKNIHHNTLKIVLARQISIFYFAKYVMKISF
jgi:hypothetical protein